VFTAGLVLFFTLHVFPFFDGVRSAVVARIGAGRYRCLYAVVALSGLTLIVRGYDSGGNVHFEPVMAARMAAPFVMLLAFTLFSASLLPGKIRMGVRHPLTIAIALWAGLHVLMNPDTHSLFLFGAYFIYAIASAISSEQRKKPPCTGGAIKYDGAAVLIGVILTAVVYRFHAHISGMPLAMS
jgi:uncharacterized membrane protein